MPSGTAWTAIYSTPFRPAGVALTRVQLTLTDFLFWSRAMTIASSPYPFSSIFQNIPIIQNGRFSFRDKKGARYRDRRSSFILFYSSPSPDHSCRA